LFRRIQFGLWDGSIESGTAQWSHGPIDVNEIYKPFINEEYFILIFALVVPTSNN
jgi:hypothetical protein